MPVTQQLPQQIRLQREDSVLYVAGQRQSIQLRRGMVIRDLMLQLVATVSKASPMTLAAQAAGDCWNCISKIEVVQNGSETLLSLSGEQLVLYNVLQYGASVPPMAVVSTNDIVVNSMLMIPFWTPRSIRPLDTALDTSLLSNLRLDIYWKSGFATVHPDATSFASGGEPVLNVWSNSSFFPDGRKPAFAGKRVTRLQKTFTAAGNGQRIDLPLGALVHSIIGTCKNTGLTADVAPPTVCRVKSGATVFAEFSPLVETRAHMARINGPYACPFSSTANGLALGASAWIWDAAKDGFLTECPDTIGFSEFYLEMDIPAATTHELLLTLIYPVRGR